MLEKGEISFICLWVLNPFVILFYQNCSSVPAQSAQRAVASVERAHVATSHGISCQPSVSRICAE